MMNWEFQAIRQIDEMAIGSLAPDTFEAWLLVRYWLVQNRHIDTAGQPEMFSSYAPEYANPVPTTAPAPGQEGGE